MNDEARELQRRLELATAAECPPDASLDTETASLDGETESLREGWLALGQLLEAAQPALDRPLKLQRPAPKRASRWSKAAAMAASLVIGVTLAWSLIAKMAVDPTQPGREIAVEGDDSKTQQPAPNDIEAEDIEPSDPSDELDWDDSLDDRIALVSQEIIRVQGDWYCLDDAFGPLRDGIDQIEQEIEDDTL